MNATLLTIFVSAFFAIRGLTSLRKAFFLLVFLAPFLPAYIAIAANADGAGISAFRIAVAILAFYSIVAALVNPNVFRRVLASVQKSPFLVLLIFMICGAKLASTAVNYGSVAYFYWAEETMQSLLFFFLAAYFFQSEANYFTLAKCVFLALSINILICLVEFHLSHPILQGILEVNVKTLGEDVLQGKFRSETYRSQALFDNTLSLAEYLIYALIFVLALGSRFFPRSRVKIFLLMFLAVVSLLMTGSRFPFIIFISIAVFSLALFSTMKLNFKSQKTLLILSMATAITSAIFISGAMSGVEGYIDNLSFLHDDDPSKRASIIERAMQWAIIPAGVSSNEFHGILGFGYKSDFIASNGTLLDNYYFRTLIEGGWISAISFLLIGIYSIVTSLNLWRRGTPDSTVYLDYERFSLFLLLFFVSFFLSKLFLSMNYNNYLLFLFLGALAAMKSIGEHHANIARP